MAAYYNSYYSRRRTVYRNVRNGSSEKEIINSNNRSIDDDILLLLYSMVGSTSDRARLKSLFISYRKKYGNGAGDYIETALYKWKSGVTKVSNQSINRLVDLVPTVLTEIERYNLLKKLYKSSAKKITENKYYIIIIGNDNSNVLSEINKDVAKLIKKPVLLELDSYVKSRMSWVCNEDSILARKLMATIEKEESVLVAQAAQLELKNIITIIQGNSNCEGSHKIVFPYGNLNIRIRQQNIIEKIAKLFA